MVVSFVFPNVRTWQQRLEALKTAGGISTSGHSLNSSSYSLCLRHKYKEITKINTNAIAKTITELKRKYKHKTMTRITSNTNILCCSFQNYAFFHPLASKKNFCRKNITLFSNQFFVKEYIVKICLFQEKMKLSHLIGPKIQ